MTKVIWVEGKTTVLTGFPVIEVVIVGVKLVDYPDVEQPSIKAQPRKSLLGRPL